MSINRRQFSIRLAALTAPVMAGLAGPELGFMRPAFAQANVDEGIDYKVLREPVATSSPGKIEILEFFWLLVVAVPS